MDDIATHGHDAMIIRNELPAMGSETARLQGER